MHSTNQSHQAHHEGVEASNATVGVVLLVAGVLAIVIDNSPLSWLYDHLLDMPFEIRLGGIELAKPLLLWINDGLMAVFFLLVGIEIKRELLKGQFKDKRAALLPLVAAIGGMVVPATIYVFRNIADPTALQGWAIPSATDIAFALGVLSLAGRGIPTSVRGFLAAVAVLDDMAGIAIIALFYASNLAPIALLLAAVCLTILVTMNRRGVTRLSPYMVIGFVLWVAVLKSGVHATLAGVLLAFTVPLRATNKRGESPAVVLEHFLVPWVSWFVLPLFAFANTGFSLGELNPATLFDPIPSGIALGLAVGKPIGIFGAVFLAIRLGFAKIPQGANLRHLLGVALLGGIGFTMSLFIGTLAFTDVAHLTSVRLGVFIGSLLAGVLGYLVLRQREQHHS